MKYLLIILLITISVSTKAQVPQKMSYQAIIREPNNNLLSLKNISMRISIIKGEFESSPVYIETQLGKTNLNGLVSLQIGTGAVLMGNFSKIDWANGPYFINTETDPDGGFDYRINGKSELLSVPYALYALNNNASFDTISLHTRIVSLQFQAIENRKDIDKNLDSIKDNAKDIKTNLDSIRVNTVKIKTDQDSIRANAAQIENNIDSINTKINLLDLIAILSNYQRIGKILNAVTIEGTDNFDVKSNGNLQSSKNITLTGNIESLGTSSSIGSLDKPFKDIYISSHSLYIESDIVGQNIPPTVLSNLNGNLEISTGGFKLMGTNAAFIAPKFEGRLIGNANTATKFEIPRTINGIVFDGSANITIPTGSVLGDIAYSSLTGAIPIWNQSTIGNAGTVTTNANLTGVVTSVGNTTSIASGTIMNSMLENASVAILSGANTGDENTTTIKTKLGITSLSGINTGDNTINSNYSSLISNAIHTGDATGSTALTVVRINGTSLAALATGILKNRTGTGVPSIAVATDFPTLNQSTTGNAATASRLATGRFINGIFFDGTLDINFPTPSMNSLTFDNEGKGADPKETYNGSKDIIISYNSIGASPLAGSKDLTNTGLLTTLTLSSFLNEPREIIPVERKNSVYKLTAGDYSLGAGEEGQVIYILPVEDGMLINGITITIPGMAKWFEKTKNSLTTSSVVWTPFSEGNQRTMVSAIYVNETWYLNDGNIIKK